MNRTQTIRGSKIENGDNAGAMVTFSDEEEEQDPQALTWRRTAKNILSKDVYEKTKKYSTFYLELSTLNEKIKLYRNIFDSSNVSKNELLRDAESRLAILK